jgi:Glycosyl transferase family 2
VNHGVDVTIVLLALGTETDLMRSADDALAQRGLEIEVLSLASRPGVTDPRLRSVDVPAALGRVARLRSVAEAARGAWITFLQAGDRWHPDRTRRMIGAIDERRAAWGYSARILLEPEDRVVGIALAEDPSTVADRLRSANVIGGPSAVVCRRALLLADDAVDARFEALACWRSWLGLVGLGPPAACAEPLVAERVDRAEMLRLPRRSLAELRVLNREGRTRADEGQQTLELVSALRRYGARRTAAAIGGRAALERGRLRELPRVVAALRDPKPLDAFAAPGWIDPPDRSTASAPAARIRRSRSGGCEVSVVVPTRNRARFLRQAVASALGQLDVDVEVIVIDDASDSPAAREALRFTDPRVRVEVRRRPGGAGRARNQGLAHARGEWVTFLDDDDLLAPTRLRAHLDGVGAAGFGFCGQLLVDPGRNIVGALPAVCASGLSDRLRTKSSIGGPSAVVVSTELVRQVGGFGEDYYALADWDLWMRLASRATATATPDLLVAYTVHASNMHLNAPGRVLADFDRFQRAHDLTPAAEIELLDWLARDLERAGRGQAAARLHLGLARRRRRPESALRAARSIRRGAGPKEPGEPHLAGPDWLRQYRVRDA